MAKQLFNSSEKSNFIVNLTEEKYSKLASFGLLAACLMTSLATMIPVISEAKMYMATALGMTVSGVICMVLALIGAMKKYIGKWFAVPLCGAGFIFLWALISTMMSYDKFNVGIYGFPGRGEGLLAIAFYMCFFITAASLKTEKSLKTVLYGVIANGILNCAITFSQVFAGEFTEYYWVSPKINLNAASGFSQSPMFLAMVLSVSMAAALMGSVLIKGGLGKLICILSAVMFSFISMFTFTFIGICGIALAVVFAIIMIFAVKAPKLNLLSIVPVIAAAFISVVIVNSGAVGNINSYKLYDGRILWFADAHMRISASGTFDSDYVDIDDTYDVYYTLNRKTMDIISGDPLFGTGPDQLVYPQLYTYGPTATEDSPVDEITIFNKGTFDKTYNEYLYTAATRGIPSAIALVITLLSVVIIGAKRYKKSKNGYTMAMVLLTVMGMLVFLIGCSNTSFSPMFWVIAGMAAAVVKAEEVKPVKEAETVSKESPKAEDKPEKKETPKKEEMPEKKESPKAENKPKPKNGGNKNKKKKKK